MLDIKCFIPSLRCIDQYVLIPVVGCEQQSDGHGITQVVFDPEDLPKGVDAQALANVMKSFTRESAVSVNGIVRKRVEGTEDARNNTGEVEVLITSAELLNKSDVPN